MLVKTKNKWDAVRALINTLLKDPTLYCNECGRDYEADNPYCCSMPDVGTHKDFVFAIIDQNKEIRKTRKYSTARGESKALRWGLSLPPKFFSDLERAFKQTYNEKLLKNNREMHRFMREFPAFTVCDTI